MKTPFEEITERCIEYCIDNELQGNTDAFKFCFIDNIVNFKYAHCIFDLIVLAWEKGKKIEIPTTIPNEEIKSLYPKTYEAIEHVHNDRFNKAFATVLELCIVQNYNYISELNTILDKDLFQDG
jgi:hypothetical protein